MMKTVKERLVWLHLREMPGQENLDYALNQIQPDGSYPGLDYDTHAEVFLPSYHHIAWVRDLAIAWRHPESPWRGNSEVREKIAQGLDWWLKKDPQTDHNWFMVIGVPAQLAKILILFDRELTKEQRAKGVEFMKRGYRASDGAYLYVNQIATGQNLLWVARIQFEAGCIEGNEKFALQAAQTMAKELVVTTAEGIQPDWSFHQHGPMLYNGAYGAYFCPSAAEILWLTRDTPFALPSESAEILSRYLLEGQQWVLRGPIWDFNVLARQIVYPIPDPDPEPFSTNLASSLDLLADLVPSKAQEAALFAKRIRREVPPGEGIPEGNRMFWRSDYMVHQRAGFQVGIKMFSTRTIGTESGYGQGLKNYYMSDGAMSLRKTGAEYDQIYPLWNWRQVPGITCALSDEPYQEITWGKGARGTTDFVGGVSDGAWGVAAFDLDHGGVRARKAWFCFEHEIICIGAGIGDESGYRVATTLEQNWRSAEVTEGANWFLHGTTGYLFPEKQNVHTQVEHRTGSWHDIYHKKPESLRESGEVFTAWIDHGMKPNNASYSYVLLPDTDAAQLAAFTAPQILANAPHQQAVWHQGLKVLGAVFYEPGSLQLPGGELLSVDQPCLVLARYNGGTWQLSVSDPTQQQSRLRLQFARREILLDLPAGANAGKSMAYSLCSGIAETNGCGMATS